MESVQEYQEALAALAWQVELGANEAIVDAPINRYEAAPEPAPAKAAPDAPAPAQTQAPHPAPPQIDGAAQARQAAAGATDLQALHAAMAAFPHCELKKGARNTVFADGNPGAPLMIIGAAPDRDEDIQGKPFAGPAGQLLDRMLAAIDLDRAAAEPAAAVYITNILPWRPPQNRDPLPEELAMLLPFVEKHIQLIAPKAIVLMGETACNALLGRRGITRLRGQWQQVLGRPALPMVHPEHLLRNPHKKRESWADLLDLRAKMRAL